MEKREIFICDCASLEHQVSFWYDEEDNMVYLEPHLVTYNSFWARLVRGVKYIFGYTSMYGDWDSMVIDNDDILKLVELLKSVKVEDDRRKKLYNED